jgi:hypothetical protein
MFAGAALLASAISASRGIMYSLSGGYFAACAFCVCANRQLPVRVNSSENSVSCSLLIVASFLHFCVDALSNMSTTAIPKTTCSRIETAIIAGTLATIRGIRPKIAPIAVREIVATRKARRPKMIPLPSKLEILLSIGMARNV